MTPNPPEILRDRGRSLEDEFFRREDKRLTERLNELRAAGATREALGKASGITEPAVLEKLMELGIRAETVAALSIVPLVEVAWADGALDAKEAGALLEAWLDRRTDPKLLIAWTHLVQAMSEQLGPDEAARLKRGLLNRARGGRRNRRSVRRWFEDFGSGGGDAGQARGRFSLQPMSTRWWSRHRRDRNADVRSGRA